MNVTVIRHIELYVTRSGKQPFITWLASLKNKEGRYRIKERLDRVALGNLGDYKYISDGVFEFRFDFGPGYRVYFGEVEETNIVLLLGGDKSTQNRDIKKAVNYWKDYLSR